MSVLTFLLEVKSEIKKVTWPTYEEFFGHMIVVSVTVTFAAIVIGVMDYLFSAGLKWLFT
jgi:preprotein translocase SecE subunit